MNKATFLYICDPGHGWLEVPRQLLHELGIEYDITRCSYVQGRTAYLEEDCDMPRFIEAFRAQLPDVELDIETINLNHSSMIRQHQPYPLQRPKVTA